MWKCGDSLHCWNRKPLGPSFPQLYQYEEFLHVFVIYTSHCLSVKKERTKNICLRREQKILNFELSLWGTFTHWHKFKHLSLCNVVEKRGFGTTWDKGEIKRNYREKR
jgi:hypothetical protein